MRVGTAKHEAWFSAAGLSFLLLATVHVLHIVVAILVSEGTRAPMVSIVFGATVSGVFLVLLLNTARLLWNGKGFGWAFGLLMFVSIGWLLAAVIMFSSGGYDVPPLLLYAQVAYWVSICVAWVFVVTALVKRGGILES